MGVVGSVFSTLTVSVKPITAVVDGCHSKLFDVVSGVPQGIFFGLLWFLLYTLELFSILEYKLIGFADDSALISVVP